jgi:hypothetical protein
VDLYKMSQPNSNSSCFRSGTIMVRNQCTHYKNNNTGHHHIHQPAQNGPHAIIFGI